MAYPAVTCLGTVFVNGGIINDIFGHIVSEMSVTWYILCLWNCYIKEVCCLNVRAAVINRMNKSDNAFWEVYFRWHIQL